MPPDKARRRPPRADVHTAAADHDTPFVTSGGPTFVWRECPKHPWYGVSVIETGDMAMCVPPLDGTANHYLPVMT